MEMDEIKRIIAQRVSEGISLSKIQDELAKEHNVKMTFMELRLLASEIESVDWSAIDRKNAPKTSAQKPSDETLAGENQQPQDLSEEDEMIDDIPEEAEDEPLSDEVPGDESKARGKTSVELSKVAIPGTVASGTVKFGSGVTGEWFVDQRGGLGFSKIDCGKPDKQDIQEFQAELQKLFGA